MLKKHMSQCIKQIYQELKHTYLKSTIHQLNQQVGEYQASILLKQMIYDSLLYCMNQNIFNENFFYSLLQEKYQYYIDTIPLMKKTMTIKAQLKDLKNIYRIIEIPYMLSLNDFACIILSTFHAEGKHPFYITQNKDIYYGSSQCELQDIDLYACDAQLSELNCQKGQHIEICYDFQEQYIIEIEILEIHEKEMIQTDENIDIKESHGYGIWEEAHWLLNLYFHNKKAFQDYIYECGYDEDDFIIEHNHDTFLKDYHRLQDIYKDKKIELVTK